MEVYFFHLVGTPEHIRERIEEIGALGAKTISAWHGNVEDQEQRRKDIAEHIMPYFKD